MNPNPIRITQRRSSDPNSFWSVLSVLRWIDPILVTKTLSTMWGHALTSDRSLIGEWSLPPPPHQRGTSSGFLLVLLFQNLLKPSGFGGFWGVGVYRRLWRFCQKIVEKKLKVKRVECTTTTISKKPRCARSAQRAKIKHYFWEKWNSLRNGPATTFE